MKKAKPIVKPSPWSKVPWLYGLAVFLVIFIPLMPKIPLADVLPGYIVRVRLEDFAILLTASIWLVSVIRHRATWHPLMTKAIGIYLLVGLLSSLSAIFITHTVPWSDIHIEKIFLHYFRRFEYFSLFFIFFAAVKTYRQAITLITLLIFIMLAVAGYGFGQKYLYWPVYSTMNREFSKGMTLYLTEHARVPSTFGGHYDAAAYTLIMLTIMVAIFLYTSNKVLKIFSGLAFLAGLWLLILTASRTSFLGYLGAVTLLFILVGIKRSWRFAVPRWLGVILFSLFIMVSFGDLSERFAQVLKLDQLKTKYSTLLFSPKVNNPVGKDINIRPEDLVSVSSDQPPVSDKPSGLPADVYEKIPEKQIYFDSKGETVVVDVDRTYSPNAYKYGLSAAIRLDALWPRAIAGFESNFLLGSGYSTLTKESVGQFTEAESTDNDYLRALGETGLLGFITFYGTIITAAFLAFKSLRKLHHPLFIAFTLSYIAATVGLLINASLLDVFESSKVAETFWAITGLVLVLPLLKQPAPTTS